jgi:hypothetical protein
VLNEALTARALCRRKRFATKAGIHAGADRQPETAEHVAPESVGTSAEFCVEAGGWSFFLSHWNVPPPAIRRSARLKRWKRSRRERIRAFLRGRESFGLGAGRFGSVPYFSVDNFRGPLTPGDRNAAQTTSTLPHAAVSCSVAGEVEPLFLSAKATAR